MSASFADGCVDSRKTTDYCPFFDRRLRIVPIQDPEHTRGSIVSITWNDTKRGKQGEDDGKLPASTMEPDAKWYKEVRPIRHTQQGHWHHDWRSGIWDEQKAKQHYRRKKSNKDIIGEKSASERRHVTI